MRTEGLHGSQSPQACVNVTGAGGLRGTIDTTAWPLDGSRREVLVRLDDGREVMLPVDALSAQADGSYRLNLSGTAPDALAAALGRAGGVRAGEAVVVPVVAEQVSVDKRTVERGRVRVQKVVREDVQVVEQPLAHEEVAVERVPVNRVVEGPVSVRQEGDTVIVPVVEEVLVVEKRLMLREEVRVTKRRVETRTAHEVPVRREEVRIERVTGDGLEGQEKPASADGGGTGVA